MHFDHQYDAEGIDEIVHQNKDSSDGDTERYEAQNGANYHNAIQQSHFDYGTVERQVILHSL